MSQMKMKSGFATMLMTAATVLFSGVDASAQTGVGNSRSAKTNRTETPKQDRGHQQNGKILEIHSNGFGGVSVTEFRGGTASVDDPCWQKVWNGYNGYIRNGADKQRYKKYMKDNLFLTRDKQVVHPGDNSDLAVYAVTACAETQEMAFHSRAGHIGSTIKPLKQQRRTRSVFTPVDYYNRGQFHVMHSAKYMDIDGNMQIDSNVDPKTGEVLTIIVPFAVKGEKRDEGYTLNRRVTIETDGVNPSEAMITHYLYDRDGNIVDVEGQANGEAMLTFESPEALQETMNTMLAETSYVGFNHASKYAEVIAEQVAAVMADAPYFQESENYYYQNQEMLNSGYNPPGQEPPIEPEYNNNNSPRYRR